jgi:hypothetical protein
VLLITETGRMQALADRIVVITTAGLPTVQRKVRRDAHRPADDRTTAARPATVALDRPARRLPSLPVLDGCGPLRLGIAAGVSAAIFAALLFLDGADPLDAFRLIWEVQRAAVRPADAGKLIPFTLCGGGRDPGAVGLINVGGEGSSTSAPGRPWLILYSGASGPVLLPLAIVAGMAGGSLWASIAARASRRT